MQVVFRIEFNFIMVSLWRWLIAKFNNMPDQNFFFELFYEIKSFSHIFLYQPVIVIFLLPAAGFIFFTISFSL